MPLSTLPTGTVPTPDIEYTSCIGILSGLSIGLGGTSNESRAYFECRAIIPWHVFSFSTTLSPTQAETGTKFIFSVL